MSIIKKLLTIVLAAALSGCGRDLGSTPAAMRGVQATAVVSHAAAQASDYRDLVQKIYVAYFGRAADPGGLVYYENLFLSAGVPLAVPEVLGAALCAAVADAALLGALISRWTNEPCAA